jgi:hypothetical protein
MERIEPIRNWGGGTLRIERTPGAERVDRDRDHQPPSDGEPKRRHDEEDGDEDGQEHIDVSA